MGITTLTVNSYHKKELSCIILSKIMYTAQCLSGIGSILATFEILAIFGTTSVVVVVPVADSDMKRSSIAKPQAKTSTILTNTKLIWMFPIKL